MCWLLQEKGSGRATSLNPALTPTHPAHCTLPRTGTAKHNQTTTHTPRCHVLTSAAAAAAASAAMPTHTQHEMRCNDSATSTFLHKKTPQRSFEPHTAAQSAAACVGPASARRFTGLQQQSVRQNEQQRQQANINSATYATVVCLGLQPTPDLHCCCAECRCLQYAGMQYCMPGCNS